MILQKLCIRLVLLHGRAGDECIFEKLDRVFSNFDFQHRFNILEVEHLSRDGSDHAPLLLKCEKADSGIQRPFKFLNFWKEHLEFKELIRRNWDKTFLIMLLLILKERFQKSKKPLHVEKKKYFW